jgi:hypothetical protein
MQYANDSPDLIYGVKAIAEVLGLREKQAQGLVDRNMIPTFRIGARVCARRSTLTAWIAEQESAALSRSART